MLLAKIVRMLNNSREVNEVTELHATLFKIPQPRKERPEWCGPASHRPCLNVTLLHIQPTEAPDSTLPAPSTPGWSVAH